MEIKNAYAVQRVPRIVTAQMRHANGGYLQGFDRRGKHYVVDCLPAHAVKTDMDLLQMNGVCMPIENPRK